MQEKPNLLFSDHDSHLNGIQSTDFFIKLLKNNFNVTISSYDTAWYTIASTKNNFSILVAMQNGWSLKKLETFGIVNIVLIPMYDDCPNLEAMASGAVIIFWDAPTMNEYIIHEHNGILFSDTTILNLNPIKKAELKKNSITRAKQIRSNWEHNIPNIIDRTVFLIMKKTQFIIIKNNPRI